MQLLFWYADRLSLKVTIYYKEESIFCDATDSKLKRNFIYNPWCTSLKFMVDLHSNKIFSVIKQIAIVNLTLLIGILIRIDYFHLWCS